MTAVRDKSTGEIIEVETEAAGWELIEESDGEYEMQEEYDGIL